MSITDLSTPPEIAVAPARPTRARVGLDRAAWARVALACVILMASGGLRLWQEHRIQHALKRGLESPLDLQTVPMSLGPWKGEPTTLDPQIARATGADQVVTRRYVNQQTGAAVDLILLFGPAVDMYIHMPEACYPAAGYALAAGPEEHAIPTGHGEAPFRALVYSKGEGARADRQEVYYTWRYNGRWSPHVGKQKHFERISGMYKIHTARHVLERERRDMGDNPSEQLLRVLLPEIEGRIAARSSPAS